MSLSPDEQQKLEAHLQQHAIACECGSAHWLVIGPLAVLVHQPTPKVLAAIQPAPVMALFLALVCRACSFVRWLTWPPLENAEVAEAKKKGEPLGVVEGGLGGGAA